MPRPQPTTTRAPTIIREKPRPFTPRPTTPVPDEIDNHISDTSRVPQIVVASAHPQDNEVPDSVHVHNNFVHNGADLPTHSLEDDRRDYLGAKLNLGMYCLENGYYHWKDL